MRCLAALLMTSLIVGQITANPPAIADSSTTSDDNSSEVFLTFLDAIAPPLSATAGVIQYYFSNIERDSRAKKVFAATNIIAIGGALYGLGEEAFVNGCANDISAFYLYVVGLGLSVASLRNNVEWSSIKKCCSPLTSFYTKVRAQKKTDVQKTIEEV